MGASSFLLSPPVLTLLGVAGTAWLLKKLYENDTPQGQDTAASVGKTPSEMAMEGGPEGPTRERPNVEDVVKERQIQNKMEDFRSNLRRMGADEDRKRIYLRDYLDVGNAIEKETAYRDWETDRKSTRLNSSHSAKSRMPSSA